VEAAKESMIGNVSSDPMTYMRLQLRCRAKAMLRELKSYIEQSRKLASVYWPRSRSAEKLRWDS